MYKINEKHISNDPLCPGQSFVFGPNCLKSFQDTIRNITIICSLGVLWSLTCFLSNVVALFGLGKGPWSPRRVGEEDKRSCHHLDSTVPAKSPPQGVWLDSPSRHREERAKLKIASGCIWAAVGWEQPISIMFILIYIDSNWVQLTKWAVDETVLCFDDMFVPFVRH